MSHQSDSYRYIKQPMSSSHRLSCTAFPLVQTVGPCECKCVTLANKLSLWQAKLPLRSPISPASKLSSNESQWRIRVLARRVHVLATIARAIANSVLYTVSPHSTGRMSCICTFAETLLEVYRRMVGQCRTSSPMEVLPGLHRYPGAVGSR